MRPTPPIIQYRGTVSGLRISAVDGGATASGGAFVDGLPADVIALITANPDALMLEAYDSAGAMYRGVLKEAGTGETYSEKLTDPTFDNAGAWQLGTGFSVSGGKGHCAGSNPYGNIFQASVNIPVGTLAMSSYELTTTSGSGIVNYIANLGLSPLGYVSNGGYITVPSYDALRWVLSQWGDFVGDIDNAHFQQVLTPSVTGAPIVNAKGGDVYNWGHKASGFILNEASYYVIVKKLR
jgi:hypothetical protein